MSTQPPTGSARTSDPQTALRRFLALDAVVTGANGLAYAAVPGPLGRLLGVDSTLLVRLGVLLALYAAAVSVLAARARPPVLEVRAVIGINAAWALLSVVALARWLEPSTVGAGWIPVQALVVAVFAALQYVALRGVRAGAAVRA